MKKNTSAISAVVGGVFFAVPYMALAVPILPSLAIGAAAYAAGELVLKEKEEKLTLKETNLKLYNILRQAKTQNQHIINMTKEIEDEYLVDQIKEIHSSVEKIIKTIEKNPEKEKKVNNFFEYYLPSVVKILDKYDDIENQKLSSKDNKKFKEKTNDMIKETNYSFKNILNNLYETDIMDTDIEMKVLNSMLKSDGFNTEEFVKKEEEDEK